MKLILVRHGETEENVARILNGHGHGKLTAHGIEQAKKTGLRLKNEKIDIAYVSDLERTCATAKEILKFHPHLPVVYTKELRERDFGIYEGKKLDKVKKELGVQGWIMGHSQRLGGGESRAETQERIVAFFDTILKKHSHQTVLLVSHGGPITLFYLHLFGKSYDEYDAHHPQNAAITILKISDDKKHTVHVLNCVKHLE